MGLRNISKYLGLIDSYIETLRDWKTLGKKIRFFLGS